MNADRISEWSGWINVVAIVVALVAGDYVLGMTITAISTFGPNTPDGRA